MLQTHSFSLDCPVSWSINSLLCTRLLRLGTGWCGKVEEVTVLSIQGHISFVLVNLIYGRLEVGVLGCGGIGILVYGWYMEKCLVFVINCLFFLR